MGSCTSGSREGAAAGSVAAAHGAAKQEAAASGAGAAFRDIVFMATLTLDSTEQQLHQQQQQLSALRLLRDRPSRRTNWQLHS